MNPEEKTLEQVIRTVVASTGKECRCGGDTGCSLCGGAGRYFLDRNSPQVGFTVLLDVVTFALELCPETAMDLRRLLRAAKRYGMRAVGQNFEESLREMFTENSVDEIAATVEANAELVDSGARDFFLAVARALRECDGSFDDFVRRRDGMLR